MSDKPRRIRITGPSDIDEAGPVLGRVYEVEEWEDGDNAAPAVSADGEGEWWCARPDEPGTSIYPSWEPVWDEPRAEVVAKSDPSPLPKWVVLWDGGAVWIGQACVDDRARRNSEAWHAKQNRRTVTLRVIDTKEGE